MHRKNPISVLVYNTLFPNPAPNDPPSFSAHLSKNLVGEVRIETATFYGSLDSVEARYPGLNYAHAPHRRRLGRFPHHRKLFEAFDRLGLTDSEIQGFCRWEGTLWARERYERDEGVKVRDTTGMEIGEWVDRRKHRLLSRSKGINVKTDIEVEIEEVEQHNGGASGAEETIGARLVDTDMMDEDDDEEPEDEEESEDEETESTGTALNQRLMRAAAMRDQGVDVVMDPDFEEYLRRCAGEGRLEHDIVGTRDALRIMADQLTQVNARASSSAVAAVMSATSPPSSTTASQSYPPAAPA